MRVGTRIFTSVSTKSVVFGSVIVFACVAFIFTGFGSLHLGSFGDMNPSLAATVDSLPIQMNEFINYINQHEHEGQSQQVQKYIVHQVIKNLVDQKILANESLKIGWTVTDKQIASAIKSISSFQDSVTHEFSMSVFKSYLKNQRILEIDFYNYIRSKLDIQNMRALLALPVVISDDMVRYQYDMVNTEFNLEYAVVNLPEKIIQKDIEMVAQKYANDLANAKQLQEIYANQKDKYNQNAKTRVRTILISFKDASRAQGDALGRTKEQAQALAESTLTRIQAGESFSKIAEEINEDSALKSKKGDLGFVDETNIDAYSLKAIALLNSEKPLSNVVDTPFGYRLFEFIESKAPVNQAFEDVKADIAKEVVYNDVKTKVETAFQNKLLSALMAKNITEVNKLLIDNGLSWKYLSQAFKITDTEISELGSSAQLAEQIFTVKNNGDIITRIINFGDKKAVIKLISINQLTPPSEAELKDLKKQMIQEQSDLFVHNFEKFIHDKYEKEGKIKINPAIMQ